jgi:hypothetical protein
VFDRNPVANASPFFFAPPPPPLPPRILPIAYKRHTIHTIPPSHQNDA